MRFAITSDMHFGSPHCQLVTGNRQTGFSLGEAYEEFKQKVGRDLDFLILLGDVFDFSISGYEDAYVCGKAFFTQIKKDGIVREKGEKPEFGSIILIPGNHDGDIWHIIQHERNVIKRIERGEHPQAFEHSTAGIIDDRKASPTYGFTLDKTRPQVDGKKKYGGMFLDCITGKDTPTTFYFAYPNLYVVTANGESILVTHGQYLETYWAFGSEITVPLAYDDLNPIPGESFASPEDVKVDVEKMVEMGFPLSQLSCTGVGQAGILTPVVRQVQNDVYAKDLDRLEVYFDRLVEYVMNKSKGTFLRSLPGRIAMKAAKREVLDLINGISETQFNEEFVKDPSVQQRFQRFYDASMQEIKQIEGETRKRTGDGAYTIPAPKRVIFGHTHLPIGWNDPSKPPLRPDFNDQLLLHNTGGWISEGGVFRGAEIFLYDSTKGGFHSVLIKTKPVG